MRILRAADYRQMAWKNGGGETIEIAVFPRDASLEDFGWRVSMARVGSDAPFSRFENVDRTLSVLTGDGIELSVKGRTPVVLRRDSDPCRFPADLETHSRLLAGPITDLNVMTRRDCFLHRVTRLTLDTETVFGSDRGVTLVMSTVACRVVVDRTLLQPLDTAVLEAGKRLALQPLRSPGPVFSIEFEDVAGSPTEAKVQRTRTAERHEKSTPHVSPSCRGPEKRCRIVPVMFERPARCGEGS